MGAQLSIDQGKEKADVVETTTSMSTNDVRLQIKSGTSPETVVKSLDTLKQYVLENHDWQAS